MKSPSTKSADDLKRDVDQDLKRVEEDFDALQARLTPGQLLDDVIFYHRGRSIGATFEHLKENPIGTTFLSLGTLLLMEDEHRGSVETVMGQKIKSIRGGARDTLQTLTESVREKISGLRSSQDHRLEEEQAEDISPQGSNAGAMPSHGPRGFPQVDPLMMMALGAGLGALTAIALPVSDHEATAVSRNFAGDFSELNHDLETALNESSSILKDLVVQGLREVNVDLFR